MSVQSSEVRAAGEPPVSPAVAEYAFTNTPDYYSTARQHLSNHKFDEPPPEWGKKHRHKLWLAARDGQSQINPEHHIAYATTHDRLDAKYQKWSNAVETWVTYRGRAMDKSRWPSADIKAKVRAQTVGTLAGVGRTNKEVEIVTLFVTDHDDGLTMEESRQCAERNGVETVIYPSFNFGATTIGIKRDAFIGWAKENNKAVEMTEALGREYLEATGALLPDFARDATWDGSPPSRSGKDFFYTFGTRPRKKHRRVSVLAEPIRIGALLTGDTTHANAIDAYRQAVLEAAANLGTTFDKSCADLARAIYMPARPTDGRELPDPIYVPGGAFNLRPFVDDALVRVKAAKPGKTRTAPSAGPKPKRDHAEHGQHVIIEDRDLTVWGARYVSGFDIEKLFERQGLVRGPRGGGGFGVHCFHDGHGEASLTETWVRNGEDGKGFVLACSGASGGCPDITDRLVRLAKYIEAGKLSIDDLEDETLGGGPVPRVKPTKQAILDMIDKLDASSTSDDLEPIIAALAQLGDDLFDGDALRLLAEKTGKPEKTRWAKALERKRRAQRTERRKEAEQSMQVGWDDPRVRIFHNWDREPFYGVAEAAKAHLVAQNNQTPRLFVRGTDIVRAVTDTNTSAKQITVCGLPEVLAEFERATTWSKLAPNDSGEGELDFEPRFTPAPKRVGEHFIATEAASLALPYLRDVMDTPYFNKKSELIVMDGYDAGSGILLTLTPELVSLQVNDNPTDDEIAEARWWLQELYIDFPFSDGEEDVDLTKWQADRDYRMTVGKGSRANQLGKTIQPFVAEMIDGNLMAHLVSKICPRTGAGYMQDGCALVAEGSTPAVETLPTDEAEVQKRLLTKAMEGAKRIIFDNQKEGRIVQSESIASAQTAGRVCGRVLGQSRSGSGPWRATVEINGNNLTVHEDIAHRGIWVELNAHRKDPQNRSGFRHTPYQQWVKDNRGKFVWAILTIVQAWIARGSPKMADSKRIIGGFEEYCRIIGGILDFAGIEGFNSNRSRIRIDAAQVDEMGALLAAMLDVFGTTEVSVGVCDRSGECNLTRYNNYSEENLVELLLDISGDVTLGLFENSNRASLGSRLGKKLGTYVGRPFDLGGKTYIFTARTSEGIKKYRLKPQNGPEIPRTKNRMRQPT